jgi:hypothetical protein
MLRILGMIDRPADLPSARTTVPIAVWIAYDYGLGDDGGR